jgi:hypothetical protein
LQLEVAGDYVQLVLYGEVGKTYGLERALRLGAEAGAESSWESIGTVTLTGPAEVIRAWDVSALGEADSGFYRVSAP